MLKKLKTTRGRARYRRRKGLVEPVFGFFAAPLHVAAGRGALIAFVGALVGAGIVALLVIAAGVRLLFRRVFGGSQVEILEQPPRQLGERRLVVEG